MQQQQQQRLCIISRKFPYDPCVSPLSLCNLCLLCASFITQDSESLLWNRSPLSIPGFSLPISSPSPVGTIHRRPMTSALPPLLTLFPSAASRPRTMRVTQDREDKEGHITKAACYWLRVGGASLQWSFTTVVAWRPNPGWKHSGVKESLFW